MADQQKWFKLWASALTDDELQRRPPELRWAWAVLGCHTKVHGTDGVVRISPANRVLAAGMGVPHDQLLVTLAQLPSITLGTAPVRWPHGHHKNPVCAGAFVWGSYPLIIRCRQLVEEWCARDGAITVTWKNWNKYQRDSTAAERMRSLRSKKRGEERRREEKDPSVSPLGGERPKTSVTSWNGQPHDDQLDQEAPEAPERGAETAQEHPELEVPEELRDAATLIEFLNAKTGRTYGGLANLQLVDARLREGWSVQDCRTMVMRKWRDWRDDPKMRPFARPSTLFNRAKLESYMAELGFRANTGR